MSEFFIDAIFFVYPGFEATLRAPKGHEVVLHQVGVARLDSYPQDTHVYVIAGDDTNGHLNEQMAIKIQWPLGPKGLNTAATNLPRARTIEFHVRYDENVEPLREEALKKLDRVQVPTVRVWIAYTIKKAET